MQQRGKNKGALPPDLEADPRHGEVVKRLPLYFTPHLAKRQKNARKIDTFNTLWHGKHHALPRIPMLGGDDTRPASDKDNWEDPPTVLWKTTRRRMEWHPENVDEKKPPLGGRGEFVPCGYDQNRWQGLATSTETERSNYKGNLTDVKYKSSVVTTDGLKYRGAVYVRDGKVHVSLMDEMYKMTPWNAHASALGSAANERTGVSQEEEATNAASARNKAIKVHVKRTETDQQEEARKRSYAYYKEVDDSDEWKYVANRSHYRFKHVREDLEKTFINPPEDQKIFLPQTATLVRMSENPTKHYLGHILAKGNPMIPRSNRDGVGSGINTPPINSMPYIKREGATDAAHTAAHADGPHARRVHLPTDTPTPDSIQQLNKVMTTALEEHTVVSRERIFEQLAGSVSYNQLYRLANTYKDSHNDNDRKQYDQQLHDWIMEACPGTIEHVTLKHDGMERYLAVIKGDHVTDPFKTTVVETLLANDGKLRKADIKSAVENEGSGIRWIETAYNKLMKAYCVNISGVWSLKTGNEQVGGGDKADDASGGGKKAKGRQPKGKK